MLSKKTHFKNFSQQVAPSKNIFQKNFLKNWSPQNIDFKNFFLKIAPSKNAFKKASYISGNETFLSQFQKTSYISGGASKAPRTKIYYTFPEKVMNKFF